MATGGRIGLAISFLWFLYGGLSRDMEDRKNSLFHEVNDQCSYREFGTECLVGTAIWQHGGRDRHGAGILFIDCVISDCQ